MGAGIGMLRVCLRPVRKAFAGVLVIAGATPTPARTEEPRVSTAAAVSASNAFGLDLYRRLAGGNDRNVFISPYSVLNALAMTAEGARGLTAEEMRQVLRLPERLEEVHGGLAALNRRFTSTADTPEARQRMQDLERIQGEQEAIRKRIQSAREWRDREAAAGEERKVVQRFNELLAEMDPTEIEVANALWAERSYPFSRSYLSTVARYYGTEALQQADFRTRFDAERLRINDWVEKHTCHTPAVARDVGGCDEPTPVQSGNGRTPTVVSGISGDLSFGIDHGRRGWFRRGRWCRSRRVDDARTRVRGRHRGRNVEMPGDISGRGCTPGYPPQRSTLRRRGEEVSPRRAPLDSLLPGVRPGARRACVLEGGQAPWNDLGTDGRWVGPDPAGIHPPLLRPRSRTREERNTSAKRSSSESPDRGRSYRANPGRSGVRAALFWARALSRYPRNSWMNHFNKPMCGAMLARGAL